MLLQSNANRMTTFDNDDIRRKLNFFNSFIFVGHHISALLCFEISQASLENLKLNEVIKNSRKVRILINSNAQLRGLSHVLVLSFGMLCNFA